MMFHHGSKSYAEAASDAARFARTKFDKMITEGTPRMAELLNRMDDLVPDDAVAPARALKFAVSDRNIANRTLDMTLGDQGQYTIHPHALGQIAQRSGLKNVTQALRGFTDTDAPAWQHELAAHTLNEAYSHLPNRRQLVRSLQGDVRGFLSDKYRRYDVRPIAASFLEAMRPFDAACLDGIATETKVSFRMVLPKLFEPVKDEIMLYGLELRNSDFGDGKLVLRSFLNRVWCTNLCTQDSKIDQVHLGSRLPDSIDLSMKTYELDTKTMASAVGDVVGQLFLPAHVNETMERVTAANADAKDHNAFSSALKNLSKGDRERVVEKFNEKDSDDTINTLPKGKSRWRMSNCLSWLATQQDNRDKQMTLEDAAGRVMAAA